MWNKDEAVSYINSHVEPKSIGKCANYVRRAVEAGGVKIRIPRPRIGNSASACDYGSSFESVGFKAIYTYPGTGATDTAAIPGQQTGDIVVIQPIDGHPHGHIALFNGTNWVSDFIQLKGFYPGKKYRSVKPAYTLYRYSEPDASEGNAKGNNHLINIVWPIPANNRGREFANRDEILSHLRGESTGLYMIGRNGMWHGGIHITNATTPWCALSGKAASEIIDFPIAYKGEQSVRCMADGEVVAYRICKDYIELPWEIGPLSVSGSFVLVKHYIQPGEGKESGLHFYTLYMHLAPYSAYELAMENQWITKDTLKAYSEIDWLMAKLTSEKLQPQSVGNMPEGARIEWNASDTSLTSMGFNKRRYGLVTLKGLPDIDKGDKNDKKLTTLNIGERYWVVIDNNNIKPAPDIGPSWWRKLMPPAKDVMKFNEVVCPTPYAISAGDSVGHLGYYQAAKDGGYEARYQVHIECISMDDNLEKFLTNPENVGKNNPLWLKYSPGLELYKKDVATKTFVKDTRVTTRAGLLTLSHVPTEIDKSTKQEYWLLRSENAYVPKGLAQPELLSQYDLAKQGFRTEISEPSSFDYLNGKTQPVGFFRSVMEWLYNAAKEDNRTSHALVKHNYQRLLKKVDSESANYSSLEYGSAFHNPDYRDVILKTIVKHPSDWYFKKEDTIWQSFLDALKKEAPEWKRYSEEFIEKMTWMREVTTEKLGPSLWHMHPIMFLSTFRRKRTGWAHSPFANLLGKVESKNDYSAYNVTKTGASVPHYKTNLTNMTLQEVMDAQKERQMFATGRFQIIPGTLKSAVKILELDKTALYDAEMQDKIFEDYLIKIKRPAINNYLEGNGSVEDAIYEWAKEFASAGVRKGKPISPKKVAVLDEKGRPVYENGKKKYKIIPRKAKVEGESYYAGDGLNKAHILPDEMVKSLEDSKNEI